MDIGKHKPDQIEWSSSSHPRNLYKSSYKDHSHALKGTTKEMNYN
jgi:hypothetical protein